MNVDKGIKRQQRDREKRAKLTGSMLELDVAPPDGDLSEEQQALQQERADIDKLLAPTYSRKVLTTVSDEHWHEIRQQAERSDHAKPDDFTQGGLAY
eukprot:4295232-Pyramimonas_sp.AAC.1